MNTKIKFSMFDKFMNMVIQYDFKEDEVIKEITNYNSNGRYYITNYGTVLTLCFNKWQIRKPQVGTDGYLYINISDKNIRIHRLVAEYFVVNPAPTEKTIVHHKDGNKVNNFYKNLVWCSEQEHRDFHKKMKNTNGKI